MERIMSPEERIKRAEEIYYRRKNQNGVRVSTTSVNIGKRNKVSLGKRMIIQLLICSCIYGLIFLIKDKDNYFSKQTIETLSNVLNYDINLYDAYNKCVEYFRNTKFPKLKENELVENKEEAVSEETSEKSTQENLEEKNDNSSNTEVENAVNENTEGAGGAEIPQEQVSEQSKTQMEIDAEYIKQNYNIIKPVNGGITSGFGDREPTEIISAFHQGVDIRAVQGTPICAAMEGTVIAASYAGDYGNHIKIQNGDVITVYAHCSEIDVSVGDSIVQNQVIGKTGATRKSNWSTFTF